MTKNRSTVKPTAKPQKQEPPEFVIYEQPKLPRSPTYEQIIECRANAEKLLKQLSLEGATAEQGIHTARAWRRLPVEVGKLAQIARLAKSTDAHKEGGLAKTALARLLPRVIQLRSVAALYKESSQFETLIAHDAFLELLQRLASDQTPFPGGEKVDSLPDSVVDAPDHKRDPGSPEKSSNQLVADLIRDLSDADADVRARAEQALTNLGAPAVPSLIAQAALPEADEIQEQAMDIITAMGIAAAPELLRIASNTTQPVVQRRKSVSLLNAGDLDPQLATPVLIQLFKGQDGNYLPDRASRLLVAIGLPAIPALITALDDQNEQIVRYTALTLGRLACQFKSPSQEIREALEQAVPKLAGLLANSLKEPPQDIYVRFFDSPLLFPLTAIATFSSKTTEAIALVKKMLAESREIGHFDSEELIRRLEDRLSVQNPDSPPEKVPQDTVSPGGGAQSLENAKGAFETVVGEIAVERERQAAKLQPVLSAYLQLWDENEQRLTRERKGRPADEIAHAKKTVVEQVVDALARLDISIYRNGQTCNLVVVVNDDHRRGAFWLMPKGSGKPVDHKANLSDLFHFHEGDPQLGVSSPRREALAEWHGRIKAGRQNRDRSENLGS